MKKHLALACLLAAVPVCSWSAQSCEPPTDYNLSAYIFSDRFACKKQENKEIYCGVWSQNVLDEKSGKRLPCAEYQQIHVTDLIASNYKPNNPIQDAMSMANKNRAKYREQGYIVEVYKCPNQNFAMLVRFKPEDAYLVVYLFHEDSDTFLSVDSKLPYNLPANSPLIVQTTQALETYLCYSFDPKKFLDTLQAPAFSFPDHRSQQEAETAQPKPRSQPAATTQAEQLQPTTSVTPDTTTPKAPTRQEGHPAVVATKPKPKSTPKQVPQAPATVMQKPLPTGAAFSLATVVFYPAVSPVQEVRHFQSADQLVDLKINFTTNKQNSFLQRLRRTFTTPGTTLETDCLSGTQLFETTQGGSYRAFLLHPNAIVSWEEPLYPQALSNDDFPRQKRQELCNLNPLKFWN